jgi:hypothetical protein
MVLNQNSAILAQNSASATGNRQQATGNRQQATGNRQQATGNYGPNSALSTPQELFFLFFTQTQFLFLW